MNRPADRLGEEDAESRMEDDGCPNHCILHSQLGSEGTLTVVEEILQ
jgi:hypothetical protein